jgi:hypothetical protein
MLKRVKMLIRPQQPGVEGLLVICKIIHQKRRKYQKMKLQVLHMQEKRARS